MTNSVGLEVLVDYAANGGVGMRVSLFFQAEDGIRDRTVTGVQTCALPISASPARTWPGARSCRPRSSARRWRSEERRVGKECRSWWSPGHYKKKSEPN